MQADTQVDLLTQRPTGWDDNQIIIWNITLAHTRFLMAVFPVKFHNEIVKTLVCSLLRILPLSSFSKLSLMTVQSFTMPALMPRYVPHVVVHISIMECTHAAIYYIIIECTHAAYIPPLNFIAQ